MTLTQAAASVPSPSLATPTIHFSGPARHTITQQLPLPNPSLKPWTWKARIDGDHWHGSPTITTPPKTTSHYALTFTAPSTAQCKGALLLRNRTTGDELVFQLSANTTEPLAEPPVTLHTQARTATTHQLTVPNECGALLEYRVESDLPGMQGAAALRVAPQSSGVYTFTCRPMLAGHFPASLTFSSYYDGRLLQRFYPLHLHVAPPPPSAEVRLACDAHGSVEAELQIANPSHTEDVQFVVEVDGRYTSGDNALTVPAGASAAYTLTYAPLIAGVASGTVSFMHPVHGEHLYRLHLTATQPPPTVLPPLKVELGGAGRAVVWVGNPLDEEVRVRGVLGGEGAEAFECRPGMVLLPPRGVGRVELIYTPTRLHVSQECTLTFRHPRAGEWNYQISCLGLAPLTPQPTTSFLSFISHSAERTITFRNPYTQPTTFTFTITNPTTTATDDTTPPPFTLTAPLTTTPTTTTTYTLPALAALPLTLTFSPALIQTYAATLVVAGAGGSSLLQWAYPLVGVGEGVVLSEVVQLECRAREVRQLVRAIELPGAAAAVDIQQLSVAMEWDDDQPPMAQSIVSVAMVGVERGEDGRTMLSVSFTFAPRKPLDVRCALVVIKAEGGRWRCPVRLIAKDAVVDDTIEMEASVGSASSVQFQLRNDVDKSAAYRAYLSTSSSPCFKVAPACKVGRLPPSSASAGCALSVTFTPLDYRLEFDGVLNVETDTTLFSFALKGRLPAYKVPKQVKAKVDAGREG